MISPTPIQFRRGEGRRAFSAVVGIFATILAPLLCGACGQDDSSANGFNGTSPNSSSGTSTGGSSGPGAGADAGGNASSGSATQGGGGGRDASRDGAGSADATGSNSSGGGGTTGPAGEGGGGGSSGGASSSSGSGSSGSSGSSSGSGSTSSSSGGGGSGGCGAGDSNLPPEPTIPSACATLQATQNVTAGGVPSESALDTAAIQAALNSCSTGNAVRLAAGGSNNAFITGPLTVPSGVSLWVDTGVTLYGTRDPAVYGSAGGLITVTGSNSGIVGDGVIDGQGGEPMIGSGQSFWDQNGAGGGSPALIVVKSATNFTLYRINLQNSPMFHVKLSAAGFVVWGVTIKTPSKSTNSVGTPLTYSSAHNTDGIDPGESASDGYIVCSRISDGDDHIAIKGSSSTGVKNITIAHNHFEAGHGMSIGSEFTGGVSDIHVYDLSIDGTNAGTSGGSSNGIRIKSDSSRGGLVNNVTYSDICVRDLYNPIFLNPFYSSATGTSIPQFTNITIQNFHGVSGGSNAPHVTLEGYDAAHQGSITLDNVIIDGLSPSNITASYMDVTLGPGNVNFTPSGANVNVMNSITGSSQPNPCTGKWVTF